MEMPQYATQHRGSRAEILIDLPASRVPALQCGRRL